MLIDLFNESCGQIESEYKQLGHRLGWRFLTGPMANFSTDVDVAFVTLNPGGSVDVVEHPRTSSEAGSAYLVESWDGYSPGQSPLQQQVRGLFSRLAGISGAPSGEVLLSKSLTAHFVPFRSPTFDDLKNQTASVAFATRLWTRILRELRPRLVITMDTTSTPVLESILRSSQDVTSSAKSLPIGWGSYSAQLIRFGGPRDATRALLRFPHLSRFKVFGRSASANCLDNIFSETAEALRQGCSK
jgi:hypothetical protein